MKSHAPSASRRHLLIPLRFLCVIFFLSLGLVAAIGQTKIFAAPASNLKDDAQWLRPAKDYASTRYSDLGEITSANVKQLKLAWSFSTGVNRGQEAAPLVVGSTM